jgi:hypothetical protein
MSYAVIQQTQVMVNLSLDIIVKTDNGMGLARFPIVNLTAIAMLVWSLITFIQSARLALYRLDLQLELLVIDIWDLLVLQPHFNYDEL